MKVYVESRGLVPVMCLELLHADTPYATESPKQAKSLRRTRTRITSPIISALVQPRDPQQALRITQLSGHLFGLVCRCDSRPLKRLPNIHVHHPYQYAVLLPADCRIHCKTDISYPRSCLHEPSRRINFCVYLHDISCPDRTLRREYILTYIF